MKNILLIILFFVACVTSYPSWADCEKWQAKVDRYTRLQRRGGSATQMNRWRAMKKEYSQRHRDCLNAQPVIERASGRSKQHTKPIVDHWKFRVIDDNDPVSQKLLETCNFWIQTYNRQPNMKNKAYRDTACRALDNRHKIAPVSTVDRINERSLEDCIKPANLMDNEVRECMAGRLEPEWSTK